MTDDHAHRADLVAEEGVNEAGMSAERAGREPSRDAPDLSSAGPPGAAAPGDEHLLDAAPEPNEPG